MKLTYKITGTINISMGQIVSSSVIIGCLGISHGLQYKNCSKEDKDMAIREPNLLPSNRDSEVSHSLTKTYEEVNIRPEVITDEKSLWQIILEVVCDVIEKLGLQETNQEEISLSGD